MRKPRDFDEQLKALSDKARSLKERKVRQLGELVIATGADALDVETLAGALLALVETKDAARAESWRKRGAGFFRRKPAEPGRPSAPDSAGAAEGRSDASPGGVGPGAP
jgi:Conjugal transfer protein TraD